MARDMQQSRAPMVQPYFLSRRSVSSTQRNCRSLSLVTNTWLVVGYTDGTALLWDTAENKTTVPWSERHSLHKGTIYCIIDGYPFRLGGSACFFSGGQDGLVIQSAVDNAQQQKTFKGHHGPVSSLCLCDVMDNRQHVLCSGGWDATARVWDVDTAECLYTLTGHKHAVTVYPLNPTKLLVTGSQDGCVRFWSHQVNSLRDPIQTCTTRNGIGEFTVYGLVCYRAVPNHHRDIIRAFSARDGQLLSCSNDGTVKAIELKNGSTSTVIEVPNHAFLYDIFFYNGTLFATASEDGTASLWDITTRQEVQTLRHPATVWKVWGMQTGVLVTISSDGGLYYWTQNPSYATPWTDSERFQAFLHKNDTPDLSDLPDLSNKSTLMGENVGDVRLFRKGSDALAYYSWTGSAWEFVVDITGRSQLPDADAVGNSNASGEYYEGDRVFEAGVYDYVFQVGFAEDQLTKKLPYRVGQDPTDVAEKFCSREGISRAAVKQIEDFIRSNSVQIPQKTTATNTTTQSSTSSKCFPFKDYFLFRTIQMEKLRLALFKNITDAKIACSDLERGYLESLLNKLSTAHPASQQLRQCELEIVFSDKLLAMPSDKLLPIFDLWRVVALHPQVTDLHKGTDGGWHYIFRALSVASRVEDAKVTMCVLRYMSNLFCHPTTTSAVMNCAAQILTHLPPCPTSNAAACHAWCAVLANMALATTRSTNMELPANQFLSLITKGLSAWEHDPKITFVLLATLGTFYCAKRGDHDPAPIDLKRQLESFKASKDTDIQACIDDLRRVCGTL